MSKHTSKFRHIYGDAGKIDKQYSNPPKDVMTSGEGQYLKANELFFAISKSTGGGPILVRRLDDPGRSVPPFHIGVARGKTFDFDFNPFAPNMIASASDDTRAFVTLFPIEGLTENITQADVELEGHQKKVTLCTFNPSAASILATGSFDRTVKVWNIEKSTELNTYTGLGDNIYSLEWNYNGELLAATSKDKSMHIYDPRQPDETARVNPSFDGAKSSKVFWAPSLNWIGACGFSKQAKRQLKIWDERNLGNPIFEVNIDQAASVLVPNFDNDIGVLFLAGKGDGSIQYFELVNDSRKVYTLGIYRNPEPQKGGGWVPKKGLDVWKCEIQRFLKLTKTSVIPISFIVPRKAGADVFQEDIFPEAFAGQPSIGADEWAGGANADPKLMSLDPAKRTDESAGGFTFQKKKTYNELVAENEQLLAEVAKLKAQLGITDEPAAPAEPAE